MKIRLRRWLREIVLMLLLTMIIMAALDWWRKPALPAALASDQWQTLNGQNVSLQALSASQPLLVYVWADWCGICRYTSPGVQRLWQQQDNVLTVAYRSGNQQRLGQWLADRGYSFPVVNDASGSLTGQLQVSATPVFMFIYHGKMITATTGWTSPWGIKARLWLAKFAG